MKIDKDKVVFLLGGRDLEMMEIKRVLNEEKIKYFDNGLSWDNAKLSAYDKELKTNADKTFYAVELNIDEKSETDKKLLDMYDIRMVDHHGEKYNHKEASLLQIFKILEKEPTRDQQLIAANDARYIDGMKCIGAIECEIADIRKRDRKLQGVTHSDELATKNDVKSKKVINGISIVYATTTHFSAITDSLYFDVKEDEREDKTIIYNDVKIVFYGIELSKLKDICKVYGLQEKDYYFGGGECGFFGVIDNVLDKEKIIQVMDDVVSTHENKEDELYSSHIFMFPFRFDLNEQGFEHEFDFYKNIEINNRVDIAKLDERLSKDGWNYEQFIVSGEDKHLLYNEYAYFYDYVREGIYNKSETFNIHSISNFYRKKEYEGGTFKINTSKGEIFELYIEGVQLRVFATGIAIISIELDNYKYKEFSDVLKINDLGRRVYPQFIGRDGTVETKEASLLAESISIYTKDNDKEKVISESFEYDSFNDVYIGNHVMGLLGKDTFTQSKKYVGKQNLKGMFYIQPSLDDRMFVHSWHGNDRLGNKLQDCKEDYLDSDDWYKYLFIDTGSATVQNENMKHELLKESTYDRWSGEKTMFGLTRYSFMCLTKQEYFPVNYIAPHMKTMYFQMSILLLAMRTSILRFSDEISPLSQEKNISKLDSLYEKYLTFYNRLYFKEVTHQDQGIELYDKGLRQMKISEHIDKLDNKFSKLFEYANLKEEKETAKSMNNLTMLGSIFLPIGLMVSLLGLGIFKYDGVGAENIGIFLAIWFSIIGGLFIMKSPKHTLWYIGLFVIVTSIMMYLFYENAGVKANASPQEVKIVECTYDTKLKSCKGEKDVK